MHRPLSQEKHEGLEIYTGYDAAPRPSNPAQKIVVTTTISSEAGKSAPAMAPEALHTLAHADGIGSVQKMAHDGRITMVKIAPRTFLGLTDGRRRVSPLQIDDNLFIFTPREDALVHLAEMVAQLIRTLPEGTPAPQVQARIEEIAAALNQA
jgi:hypothetical protein